MPFHGRAPRIVAAMVWLARRAHVGADPMTRLYEMPTTSSKFSDLTTEAPAARVLHRRELGFTSVRLLAAETGLPVERTELLICRALSTLLARGYPAEDLCETYRVTPKQLSRVATVPAFSSAFEPLAASR